MKGVLQSVRKRYWDNRAPEEQRLLRWMGWLMLPLLGYFVLWMPAHQAVSKLQAKTQLMALQAERLHAQADEVEMLRHRPRPAALDAVALKAALEESATRHGLRDAVTAMDLQQPNAVRIAFGAVAFEQWLRWLRALQQEQHVRADSLSISILPQPGMVKVSATLINGGDQ